MIILGGLFLGSDVMNFSMTSTSIENITNITIYNAMYDDLYVTNATDYDLTATIDQGWTFNTILWATFDESTSAGNVDWDMDNVTQMLVKRKRSDEFNWITIAVKDVSSVADCNFYGQDYTAMAATSYDYAAVPIIKNEEGFYNTTTVEVKLNNLMICDYNQVWVTALTDGNLDTVSSVPCSSYNTLNNRFPTIIRNTSANFDTVSVNAEFVPFENCQYQFEGASVTDYRKQFKEFLRNGNPKILKSEESRMWLCYLTTDIQDSAQDVWWNRRLTFDMTEIGDYTKENDLYRTKFIDTPQNYWTSTE